MIAWPPGAWQHAASGPGHHHNYNHLGLDVALQKHHQPLYSQVVSWKFGNNYVYPTKQVLLFLCLSEYSLKTILCWILITLMTQILIRKLSKEKEISVSYLVMTKTWCSKLRCWYLKFSLVFWRDLKFFFFNPVGRWAWSSDGSERWAAYRSRWLQPHPPSLLLHRQTQVKICFSPRVMVNFVNYLATWHTFYPQWSWF